MQLKTFWKGELVRIYILILIIAKSVTVIDKNARFKNGTEKGHLQEWFDVEIAEKNYLLEKTYSKIKKGDHEKGKSILKQVFRMSCNV